MSQNSLIKVNLAQNHPNFEIKPLEEQGSLSP
jgi:hypothetical protein